MSKRYLSRSVKTQDVPYEMSKLTDIRQADFLRNGSAKGIMSMSKEHSTQLWNALQDSMSSIRPPILISVLPRSYE